MNIFKNPKHLPFFAFLTGTAAGLLRKALYAFALDHKGLLISNHPLELILTVFTLLSLGLIIAAVWRLDGSARYGDNFAPSSYSMVGHMLAGWGIFLTVMLNRAPMQGLLGNAWDLLGLASLPCLTIAGLYRKKGRVPFFLLHLVPCLFLVFHIVNHYQAWSGNPQLQDDIYTVFATMALMFFAFYTASFDVDSGKRRMHLGMGLCGLFLSMVTIQDTQYLFLYTGLACWAGSDLCSLIPVPKPPEEKKEEGGESQ